MLSHSTLCRLVAGGIILVGLSGQAMAVQQYRVTKGDNLFRIGKKFGVPYQEIMEANKLKNSMIYVNQVLVIPERKARPASAPNSAPQTAKPNAINAIHSGPAPDKNLPVETKPTAPEIKSLEPQPAASVSRSKIESGGEFSASPLPKPRDRVVEPVAMASRAPLETAPQAPASPLPKPRDPVEPFVSAVKLPTPSSLPPTPPKGAAQDPLGIGSSPSSAPYRNTLPPAPPKPLVKAQPVAPSTPPIPERPARYREVPAAAQPEREVSNAYTLEPHHYPTPSFNNAHKPSRIYTVKNGDTIWKISRQFGVSPAKLRQANDIMMFRGVQPGMKLTIPDSHGIWAM